MTTTTTDPTTTVDDRLAAYGEPDPARRAELVAVAWAEDGQLVDPPLTAPGTTASPRWARRCSTTSPGTASAARARSTRITTTCATRGSSWRPTAPSRSAAWTSASSPAHELTAGAVATPLRLRHDAGELSFISTVTTFGTALDVTLAELAIEAFLPADAATAALLHAASRAALA